MSDIDLKANIGVESLARQLSPEKMPDLRLAQILSIEGLEDSPPTVWIGVVGEAGTATQVRIVGKVWDYHPGDTIVYQQRNGMSVIVGKLAGMGTETDPNDDDYPAWNSPTLQNSWIWWGSPHATPGWYQQTDNWVHVKGLVKSGTTTAGTVVADGFPPPAHTYYFTCRDAGTGCVLRINTSGELVVEVAPNNSFLSFAGITYPAINLDWDSSSAFYRGYWEVPLMQTGWNKGAQTESEIEFYVRPDGWVWMKGVLETATVPGKAMDIPDRAAPGWTALIIPGFGFGVSRHDLGGGDAASNRGPTTWRVEGGGGSGQDHYLGGMNWWGRGAQALTHYPEAARFNNFSFLNSWANFGTDFRSCRYLKDAHGIVHLMGLAQGSSSTADTITNLPAGFRPLETHVFTSLFGTSGNTGRVDVEADGDVIAVSHPNNTWATLDGIHFRAEQ